MFAPDDVAKVQTPAAVGAHPLHAWLAHPPACLALASRPTPVERAAWLDASGHDVWVKRDDRTSALYGGGKVRKLEWALANPPFCGDTALASVGGIGSHHLVALALFLQRQQRVLHALAFEQELTPHVVMNLATLLSVGSKLWIVPNRAALPLAWWRYHVTRRPSMPAQWMAAGASTPLGCFGFVEAGLELAQQIEAGELPRPGTLYVTAGTAGTAAGLALGLALARLPVHLRLVSAVERVMFNRVMFAIKLRQVHASLRMHGLRVAGSGRNLLRAADVTWSIDAAQVGGGYGVGTREAVAATELAASQGLMLETTYTGKCVAALRHDLESRAAHVRPGPVVLWNTHGCNDLREHIRPGWSDALPQRLRARVRAVAAQLQLSP